MVEARYGRHMRAAGTSAMVLLRGLVHAASALGVDANTLLARVGVTPDELDGDTLLPAAVFVSSWQVAPALSGDPMFGLHAGEHAALGSYDVLDYLFLTSATLGEACRTLERYYRIATDVWRFDLLVEGEVARFRLWVPPEVVEPLRHAWDFFFSGSFKRIRSALGDVVPLEVHLMQTPPADPREYERVFQCPVTFGHPIGEFVFEAKLLERRLTTSNPTLHRLVRRHAEELLARVPSDQDLLVRAQTLLPVLLDRPELSLAYLADQLGVGERSLQRKLAEHGITYKDLVQRVREEHALRGLESRTVTVQELAYTLGFASTAAFSRAFKRWRGMSPSEWQVDHARRAQSTD
jgi:AraC-like DNA-binding protein